MNNGNLRYQKKCCGTCRYYRISHTGCYCGECLLLGRTLMISNNVSDFFNWEKIRICDFWKHRPKKWIIETKKNPYWYDLYYKRETLINLRKKKKIEK